MIVVADTSVLCYLVLIEQIELLPYLFGQIAIPQAVFEELRAEKAPAQLQEWMTRLPKWLKIYSVTSTADITLERLHSGEREAILLAEELKADLIILDEKAARQIARERGLNLTGLLGILELAATRRLINLQTLNSVKKANKKLSIAGFVPTRYAKSNSADVRTLGAIQEQLSSWGQIFPPVPRATAFVDASEEREPLAVYAPRHPAVALLDKIAQSLASL